MGSKYLLPCSCGRKTPVEGFQAGQRVRCPCGAELDVPSMLGLARLELAKSGPVAEPSGPRWGIRQRLPLIGGLIFLIGIVGVVALWLTRPRPPDIRGLSPAQAISIWHQFREGIGTQPLSLELWYMEASRWYLRWMVLAGAVALIGALVLVGSIWLVGRRQSEEPLTPDPSERPNRVTAS